MRGDAGLGDAVHVFGANLHFDGHAIGTEQSGVQRLITVDARNRDVVLEATRHRPVHTVHRAHGAITSINRVDDDAQSIHIDDLGQRRAFTLHLFVDAKHVLLARFDSALHACFGERRAQLLGDARQKFFLIAACAL